MSTISPRRSGTARSRRGETVGPYRIEGRLGRGAMGEVFRAFDQRLGRHVALKQIHAALESGESSRRRMRHEARSAARLNHPAIVQVHDILREPSGDFIVMELVEGRSLGELLSGGALPAAVALAYAADIAAGLAAAHAEGIVHRDLKKENVVVTPSGRPKILDFGLAKDLRPDDGAPSVEEGQVIGTPRAMSPEQAQGQAVDARADIFALGSLLYEMLTGIAPFDGDSAAEALHRVCHHAPPPPSQYVALPPAVDRLVLHLLDKRPSKRPQTAGWLQAELRCRLGELTGDEDLSDLLGPAGELGPPSVGPADLRWRRRLKTFGAAAFGLAILGLTLFVGAGLQTKEENVLAVARFEMLGGGARASLSAGLPDSVTRHLRGLDGVVARAVERTGRDVLDDRDAAYLLHGSIQWTADGRVKVQPAITRVEDGAVIWTEPLYGSAEQIPRLEDQVVAAVVEAAKVHLSLESVERSRAEASVEPAGRFRLSARIAASGDTRRELDRAITLLRSACSLSPKRALYWADLAETLASARRRGILLEPSVLSAAAEASAEAMALAPRSPWTWRATGSVLAARGELDKALGAYRAASRRAPEPLRRELASLTAWVLRRQGDAAGARGRLLDGGAGEPWPPESAAELVALDAELGHSDAAHRRLEDALRIDPGHPRLAESAAGLALAGGATPAVALGALLEAAGVDRPRGRVGGLAASLALGAGNPEQALALLDGAPPAAYGAGRLFAREHLRAKALRRLGRPNAGALGVARRDLEAEVALTNDARSLVALAAVEIELGELARARTLLRRALAGRQVSRDAVVGGAVAAEAAALYARLGRVASPKAR